jgi:alpha-1,2-mannosyltransferase
MSSPLNRRTIVVALVAAAIAIALALPVGRHQRVGEDFHVFWQAGRNFATGAPLYHDSLPGARPLKYPPFAAMVFTPLAVFSLPVAAVLVSLLNLGLWVASAYLTRNILARTFPDRVQSRYPLVLALLLSAQFFLDNFHHVQMNGVTFALVLLGIHEYLRGRDVPAAASIVAATALKITPIFFAAWLVIRGRRRAAVAVVLFAFASVLVPMVLRGPSNGAAELVEYYHKFLEGHQHGEIGSYHAGQNVAALVSRMTRPDAGADGDSFRYLPASEPTAQRVYAVLWVTVLLAFLAKLIALRFRGAAVSAFELAMVFLTSLLLSPITFTTHLVPLLFIFAVLLSVRPAEVRGPVRVLAAVLVLGMTVCGLSGRDLAGDMAYRNVGGYSICAWTMLVAFAAMVVVAGDERFCPVAGPPSK